MKVNFFSKRLGVTLLSLCLLSIQSMLAENLELVSPNGLLKVTVNTTGNVSYAISHNGTSLLLPSEISMNFDNGITAGVNGTFLNSERRSVDETIEVVVGKNDTLEDKYNELTLIFGEKYSIIFRAYDEGIAYRFKTDFDEANIIVNTEGAEFVFAGNPRVYYPEKAAGDRLNHWERSYKNYNSISSTSNSVFAVYPVLFTFPSTTYKVALLEAGLLDYPGLYIQKKANNSMKGLWPQYPDEVEDPYDPVTNPNGFFSNHYPLTRFDYLARTVGKRTYPWRVIVVSNDDKSLLNNEIVYKLAEPCKLTDVSWIQPGKSAWEWGHKALLEGVSFSGVLGLPLYKYYVDFAAENNLEYMTLDSGWDAGYLRPLCDYATSKGVKIIVWTWTSLPIDLPGWIGWVKDFGVSGYKIDFVNRDDQIAINWMETLAQKAADVETVIVFHGCPPPTGLSRTYPNVLNWEAVRGMECNRWDATANPDYYTMVPFMRMLSGPLDITPGSLQNHTRTGFKWNEPNNSPQGNQSAMGTRSHQLALYVIYDQPLAYLIDSPTEYDKQPIFMKFLQKVPTVWNKTVPLSAKFGEYAVMAKQSGDDWYVGGLSNWDRRTVNVDFSFLTEGMDYTATIYRDSTNSSSYPKNYVYEKKIVTSKTSMDMFMADGGGFAMTLSILGPTIGIDNAKKASASGLYFDKENMLNVYSKNDIHNVKIYDITGQLVVNEFFGAVSDSQKINISNLNKGIYILEINTEGYTDILKFIF